MLVVGRLAGFDSQVEYVNKDLLQKCWEAATARAMSDEGYAFKEEPPDFEEWYNANKDLHEM